jgi:hypothetical protein
MTLEECRAHIGRRVAYRAGSRLPEEGVITSVATTYAFIRYGKAKFSTATRPEDLTLLEEPS